jgi:hypothetical protein
VTDSQFRIVVTPRGADGFHTTDDEHDARILADIIRAAVRVQYGDGAEVRQIRHHEPPSRFHATPAQIDEFLRRHFAEDTLLRYQWAIGNAAVHEAAEELRAMANGTYPSPNTFDEKYAEGVEWATDEIDPLKGGGHWPSALIAFATEEQ